MATCDVCRESEEIVLTKHHYTRQEKHILKMRGGRNWIYRCANCHTAFNRLGATQFYAPGGYYEVHSMTAKRRGPARLIAKYTRSTRLTELF